MTHPPGDHAIPDDHAIPAPIDARGLRCPLPIIRLAAVARDAEEGAVLTLWSTDPAAEPDVAAWCRMRGHELIDQQPDGDHLVSRVRVRTGTA